MKTTDNAYRFQTGGGQSPVLGRVSSPELEEAAVFSRPSKLDVVPLTGGSSEFSVLRTLKANIGLEMMGPLALKYLNLRMKDLSSGVVAVIMLVCASAMAYIEAGTPK